MWDAVASAPLPMYTTSRKDKRKQSKPDISSETSSITAPAPPPPPSLSTSSNVAAELLEPAVDGPPSPERLRQINKQMKGSMLERSHHQQSSSGSSSLRSFTSGDRPSWEQTLESISLSRRSSSRSTTSSMPSRERPDSVQIFGKAIFNRRGKLKRESKSSSGSSLYSGETEAPPTSNPTKDYFIPIVLRRRRATTTTMKEPPADVAAAQQKRIQISGPYNFQHVTHARREAVPEGQTPNSGETTPQGDDVNHFSNFSSEAIHLSGQQDTPGLGTEPHTRISVTRPLVLRSQTSPPRRLVKRTKSQEQMRIPPPRPPRSPPLEPSAPPVPPPRVSSRATMQYGDYDPIATTTIERPATGNGFRQPQPFSPPFEYPEPPMTAPGYGFRSDEMEEYFDPRFSHAITTPDDAAWPMTSSGTLSFENTLPEVPEEEENNYTTTRSRLSMTSTSSSLRGSQSVPALRLTAHRQSNASDTLGRFDVFAAQKALKETMDARGEALPRENWEDVIDYCYDHEAEADFDYEWERPSLDMARDLESCTPPGEYDGQGEESPYLMTPCRFDVPELSPASQISNAEGDEVLTPLIPQAPSNFSLPRKELQQGQQGQRSGKPDRVPHIRTPSHASSFKESHGFNLSPSLLIPNDYHQQMLLARTEHSFYPGEEDWVEAKVAGGHHSATADYLAEPQTTLNANVLRAQLRGSVSSIGTDSSGGSGCSPSETSSAERHISATSTSTAYSRFTVSSNPDDPLPTATTTAAGKPGLHSLIKEALSDAMDSSDNVSTMGELPKSTPARREHSRNRSVPLNVAENHHQRAGSPKESIKTRRQRSRTTTSVSGTPIYGLFPPVNTHGNRI